MSKSGFGNLKNKLNQGEKTKTTTNPLPEKVVEGELLDRRDSPKADDFNSKAAWFGLGEKALDTLGDVANMIDSFQKTKQAKEMTSQVRMQTNATIEGEKQQTKRLKEQMKAQVKQEQIKAKTELAKVEKDIIQIQADLKKAGGDQKLIMEGLQNLEKSLIPVRHLLDTQIDHVKSYYAREEMPPTDLMDRIENTMDRLIHLSQEIVKVRAGLSNS